MAQIEELMKYESAGDPMTGVKWMRRTPAKIAQLISESTGVAISRNTVAGILRGMHFSLKLNRKNRVANSHPERDRQFGVIRDLREQFESTGNPIISVDTKKRELVGQFKNNGRMWLREPINVNIYDFPPNADAIAIPYGIYDVQANEGVVVVGVSRDTPRFAVTSIATWWRYRGRWQYPGRRDLLILADGGGSNGYRCRAWKWHIQEKLCDPYQLCVTVAHYPTGASKWNPVEHRLFSEISKAWAGHPLESLETVLNYIRRTTTRTGLEVRSYLDVRLYPPTPDDPLSREPSHPLRISEGKHPKGWSYTIYPR